MDSRTYGIENIEYLFPWSEDLEVLPPVNTIQEPIEEEL